MTKFYYLFVGCLFIFTSSLQAQKKCGAMQLHEDKLYQDPNYAKGWEHFQRQRIEWMNQAQSRTDNTNCQGGFKTIPVVVHYEYNPTNATERTCLINLANSQIAHMNQAYSGQLCQDASPTTSSSGGCLQFVLANQNHPASANLADGQPAVLFGSGVCPNGPNANGDTSYIPCAVPEWKGYLNIVVKIPLGMLAGVANLPPTSSLDLVDGDTVSTNSIILGSCDFGVASTPCGANFVGGANCQGFSTTGGRTVTHEFGHFLGLPHTFCADRFGNPSNSTTDGSLPNNIGAACENQNICGGGCTTNACDCDGFADTPPQAYSEYTAPCDAPNGVLPNPSTGTNYNYNNFMDYIADKCMTCFSTMQANQIFNRARHPANTVKPNVFNAGGNTPTCPPNLAQFTAPQVIVTNSTCPVGQTTPSGGSFTAPTGCPAGSTIQYSTDQGRTWSNTLPQYDQTNTMFVDTRCLCDIDNNVFSTVEVFVRTAPAACMDGNMPTCPSNLAQFTAPQVIVTNSTCPAGQTTPSGGSFTAPTGCPAGTTIQYSADQGQTWSNNLPQYDQNNSMFVDTRCLCDSDNNVFSTVEVFVRTNPGGCDGAPPIGGDDGVVVGDSGGDEITCANVLVSSTGSEIMINNFAPVTNLKLYLVKPNGGWELARSCNGDCGPNTTFSNLAQGNYIVQIDFFTANYGSKICDTQIGMIVGSGVENCPDGSLKSNSGTACNDGNANTVNDKIQEDGCTCRGEMAPNGTTSCDDITVTAANGRIRVGGLNAPIAQVKLYQVKTGGGWELVNRCNGDCGNEQTFTGLAGGNYIVDVVLYSANYTTRICGLNQMITLGNALNTQAGSRSIQLLELAAYKNKRAIDLQWLTNTGYKNERFEMEKSTDGQHFTPIFKIANTTKRATTITYKETDINPQVGMNYYRLKQFYTDGSFDYTPIQQVNFTWDINAIRLFPNPAKDLLHINLGQKINKKASIQIMDAFGKIYIRREFEKPDKNTLQLPIQQLNNGLYYISIKIDNQPILTRKIVVNQWD